MVCLEFEYILVYTAFVSSVFVMKDVCRTVAVADTIRLPAGEGGLLHALMKRTKGVELEERLFSLGSVTSPAAKGLQKLEEAKRKANAGGGGAGSSSGGGSAGTPKNSKDKKVSGKGGGGAAGGGGSGSKNSKKDSARKKKK